MSETKQRTGIIYRSTPVYRAAMNTLYAGRYRERFRLLLPHLGEVRSVLELCFGDTLFAGMCRKRGIEWTGMDMNGTFVKNALKKRLNAQCVNIRNINLLPCSDCIVISGSLYHFHEDTDSLFGKMLQAAPRIVISEPVRNLSSRKDMIGRMASACSGTREGAQPFRYTCESLTEEMKRLEKVFSFQWKMHPAGRDSIITIEKNGNQHRHTGI